MKTIEEKARKYSNINENIARQKFLQWVNSQIVSVEEYPKNNETIMDFLNGFRE